jgi:hypothetical protein
MLVAKQHQILTEYAHFSGDIGGARRKSDRMPVVLVCLTRAGLAAHDAIVTGAQERNGRLLAQLSHSELETLLAQIDRLTEAADEMLAAEKELG